MIPDYQRLASELGSTLAKYRPAQSAKPIAIHTSPSRRPGIRRAYYLKWKAKQPVSPKALRYGKLKVEAMFNRIAGELGISPAAARMRYYRGQLKAK